MLHLALYTCKWADWGKLEKRAGSTSTGLTPADGHDGSWMFVLFGKMSEFLFKRGQTSKQWPTVMSTLLPVKGCKCMCVFGQQICTILVKTKRQTTIWKCECVFMINGVCTPYSCLVWVETCKKSSNKNQLTAHHQPSWWMFIDSLLKQNLKTSNNCNWIYETLFNIFIID